MLATLFPLQCPFFLFYFFLRAAKDLNFQSLPSSVAYLPGIFVFSEDRPPAQIFPVAFELRVFFLVGPKENSGIAVRSPCFFLTGRVQFS